MFNLIGFRVCSKLTTFQTARFLRHSTWENQPMSALGQKQTCAARKIMSALPPKADFDRRSAYVRLAGGRPAARRGYLPASLYARAFRRKNLTCPGGYPSSALNTS
jgi:hypothetical protein